MTKIIYILLLFSFLFSNETFAQTRHAKIKNKMKLLKTLLGNWDVESEFTARSGNVRREKGVYEISWALDSTYFKWSGQLTNIKSKKKRKFICWITFDDKKNTFKQIFMYSKSATQIIALGRLDSTSLTYITHTKFQLSDGVTEILRNEISLKNPNQLEFKTWAKFDDALEVNNLNSILTRIKED